MQKSSVEFLHGQIFQLHVHCKQNKNQHIKIIKNGLKLKSAFPTDKYKT